MCNTTQQVAAPCAALTRSLPDRSSTLALGAALAKFCDREIIFYLIGELGVGKTTFCQGFISALGYRGAIKSPTYTLVEPYSLSPFDLYHFDLYRLTDPEALELIGIRDYQHPNALILIEWPQRGIGYLPPADLTLTFFYQLSKRWVVLQAVSPQGRWLLQKLVGGAE